MSVQATELRRLMLRALKQLSEGERKELVQLYELDDGLVGNSDILSALTKDDKLLMNSQCLDLFIVNLEAINNSQSASIIDEAKKLKGNLDHSGIMRQESLPFTTQTSPPTSPIQDDGLAGMIVPAQEEANRSGNDAPTLVTGNSDAVVGDSIGGEHWQSKRPRYDSQQIAIAECDSTYNSEESENEDEQQQQVSGATGNEIEAISDHIRLEETDTEDTEDLPKVATGEDLKFMEQTIDLSKRSGDPHTKVGAIVVKDGRVIGEGWNYLPCDDLSWDRQAASGKEEDTKYPYVTHAAVTALHNAYKAKEDPSGATIYTTMFPSSRDGVFILESKVKEVVFLEKSREWRKRYHTGATKRLFDGAVECRQVYLPED